MLKSFLPALFFLAVVPFVATAQGSWQGTDACIKAIQQKYQPLKDGIRKKYYYTKPYSGVAFAHECWSGEEVCIKHNSRKCCICPELYKKEYDKVESNETDEVQKCYEQGRKETERLQQEQEKAQAALKQQSNAAASKTYTSSSSSSNYNSSRSNTSSGYSSSTTSSTTNAATQRNQAIMNNLNQQLENNRNTYTAISNGIQDFGNLLLDQQKKKNQERDAARLRKQQEEADENKRKEEERLQKEQQQQAEAERLAQLEQQNKILAENEKRQRDQQWSIDKEIIGENLALNRKPTLIPDNIRQVYYVSYQRNYNTGEVTLRSYTLNKYSDDSWMLFNDMLDKIGFQLYFNSNGVGQLLGFYTSKKEAADVISRIKKIAKIKSVDDSFLPLTPAVKASAAITENVRATQLMDSAFDFDQNGLYTKAMVYYKKAAALGNLDAQNNIGVLYENGQGVKQNYSEAAKWYQQAAGKGHVDAERNLGDLYMYGNGVTQNPAEAMKWYRKAAEQGDAAAQYHFGIGYTGTMNLPANDSTAMAWLNKSAEQNYTDAIIALAVQYEYGSATRQADYNKAISLFKRAAADSNAVAAYELGNIYANGYDNEHPYVPPVPYDPNSVDTTRMTADTTMSTSVDTAASRSTTINVPRDYAEASKWYKTAATYGNTTAMIQLGKMYWLGQGNAPDENEADKWFNKAATADSSNAFSEIANLFAFGFYGEKESDFARAMAWRKKAAAIGNWSEMINIGIMYKNALGVDKNPATANTWFAKAIQTAAKDKMDARAMFLIGNVAYLSKGKDISSQEIETGIDWLAKAANKNDADAASSLAYYYKDGKLVKQDKQKAIYWFKKVVNLRNDTDAKQMLKEMGVSL
ncbi:MAG: SEL1-like repeat protein [Filimonas sp.]|nr:SEL1-like repeat protein [Filimonas sp.]